MVKRNKKNLQKIYIPYDVAESARELYECRLNAMCCDKGTLFLFAADQKIEHLNDDFYGPGIAAEANDPEYLFRIARDGHVGAFAIHGGMFARYAGMYPTLNYIVKLNGKTNRQDSVHTDPRSALMWDIGDLLYSAEQYNINLCGVGFTIYIGGEHEAEMLAQASRVVVQAHREGLVVILWIYPRARHIKDVAAPALIQGAAGLGNALGADFVKVHVPYDASGKASMQALKVATEAAGNTGVIVSGGEFIAADKLLHNIYQTIHGGGAVGAAIGRNIFQRPYNEAILLCEAISALVYNKASYDDAIKIVEKKR